MKTSVEPGSKPGFESIIHRSIAIGSQLVVSPSCCARVLSPAPPGCLCRHVSPLVCSPLMRTLERAAAVVSSILPKQLPQDRSQQTVRGRARTRQTDSGYSRLQVSPPATSCRIPVTSTTWFYSIRELTTKLKRALRGWLDAPSRWR